MKTNAASTSGSSRRRTATIAAWSILLAATIASVSFDFAPARFLRRRRAPSFFPPFSSGRRRGRDVVDGTIDDDDGMAELRRLLLRSGSADDYYDYDDDYDHDHDARKNGTASVAWSDWHDRWSALSDSELGAVAYDASPLSEEEHEAWGAAYVGGRRTGSSTARGLEEAMAIIADGVDDADDDDAFGLTAFLRGAVADSGNGRGDYEGGDSQQRRVSSWTMHGAENDPNGGYTFPDIEQLMADASESNSGGDEPKAEERDMQKRLADAVKATQALNERHAAYDTNEEYGYSDPGGGAANLASDNEGQQREGDEGPTMQQFSHTAHLFRQRLLTGSYAAWQWYDRDSLASPSNLKLEKVSRVNYAFFQTDADGYVFGTDSWADPNVLFGPYEFATSADKLDEGCRGGKGRDDGLPAASGSAGVGSDGISETTCEYFEQCHRNFPDSKSCNIHKHKEGLIYRAHIAGAQIFPSIGGWTLSGSFPTVAASASKRRRFAEECVGLIDDYGFDGIDIDWEYPGYEPHGGSSRDRENFNKLLIEVREALNEYQFRTGDAPLGGGAFGLTAALPCGPANINFLDVPYLANVLDGMNLMTFDFHNEMEKVTGANSPLYDQEWDVEEGLSVDGCVKNYYEAGAGNHADKISIGVPFYGKTFSFATELNGFHSNTDGRGGGMVDQGNWPLDLGTPVYYNILDKLEKGGMVSRRHEPTMTQYAYFKDGSGLVTYDDPQAVCDKANYVNMNLLGGLFIWEMSGDLVERTAEERETPLLDAINRKLEESNFDCRSIASPEAGTVVALPDPAPKGPSQIERREDESVAVSVQDHLAKAEMGELVGGQGGKGAFTRAAFMYRTWDGRMFPSYVYRYPHFADALKTMSTIGVDGELFYLGYGQRDDEDDEDGGEDDAVRRQRRRRRRLGPLTGRRGLQAAGFGASDPGLGPTEPSRRSLVYGLVNVAAFLAQAISDSIVHDACDELNIDHLPPSDVDGIGMDDGEDAHRFPTSNACGQGGRSYQDETCSDVELEYDCVRELNIDGMANMEAHGTSRGHWTGAPGPFYCGPRSTYPETGFWDAMEGREIDGAPSTPNGDGRTDVEGCCWWGRGSLSIKGTCLYGKLNYHIGKKAKERGVENPLFPEVDFCRDPGEICTGQNSIELRWISGMYHWMENVQKYDRDGFKYMDELVRYVNEDLSTEDFFEGATNVHVLGCHQSTCSASRSVDDMGDRLRSFERILSLFGLQFGSHAEPEPPFQVFPGQQRPTPAPTVTVTGREEILTPSPSASPVGTTETEIVPVNVYLTGVPDGVNMTNSEQQIFEALMSDLLEFRLNVVDMKVLDVSIRSQTPNPEFDSEVFFSQEGGGGVADEDGEPVLQLVVDVEVGYEPPVPDVVRDWSIYIKAWIESFGTTMVEIFTSPKHIQHPQTNSKFWDGLSDVSATNINPPNTDPTTFPTQSPTFIIYPDNSANTYIFAGVGAAAGLFVCLCCGFFCMKLRQYRQLQEDIRTAKTRKIRSQQELDDEERRLHMKGAGAFDTSAVSLHKPLPVVTEEDSDASSDEESSSDSSSSSSSSDSDDSSKSDESENSSSSSSSSEGDDTYQDDDDETNSRSTYSKSIYSEGVEQAPESVRSRSTRGKEESFSTFESRETASTQKDEAVSYKGDSFSNYDQERSQSSITGMQSSYNTGMQSSYNTGMQSTHSAGMQSTHSAGMQSMQSGYSSSYVTADTESEDASSALTPGTAQEREYEQFDEIVERVLANDAMLKQVVLDGRKRIVGRRHGSETLWNALVGNTYVQRLSLRDCSMTDEEVASLSLALVDNATVTHIWLGDNDITSEGVDYLIATLETNQTIVHLDLSGNPNIDPSLEDDVKSILMPRENKHQELDEVEVLMERVRGNDPTLIVLNLSSMEIGTRDDALSIFDAFAVNNHVQKVDLSSNDLDDECLSSLSLSLLENTSITHLNLSNNAIFSEGAEYLIGTLNENQTLKEIDLRGNQCDPNDLEEINFLLSERQGSKTPVSGEDYGLGATIRRLLENDPNLIELSLDGADLLHNVDTERLIDAVASNTCVTTLSFDDTDMDDTLVAALSLALVDNQTISHLSLRDNQITNEGCEYLLGTLDSNTAIVHLDLSGNLVDEHLMEEIDAIVSGRNSQSSPMGDEISLSRLLQRIRSNDPTLTELVLDDSPDNIHSHDFEAVLDAVGRNSVVKKLSFCNTDFDDSLVAALSLALVDNTVITHVLLSDNQISSDGCEYILGTLDSNTTVSFVELSGNLIDEHLMDEINAINSSRNSTANRSPSRTKSAEPTMSESNVDLSKPPMHEVPEESDAELAKREAIKAIMRDTSIPWPEKNQRIIELQQQYYVPEDGNKEPAQPQASETVAEGNIGRLIDRVFDNDQQLEKVELDGQDLSREDETALFDALAHNSHVTSLSLVNCRIANEGAAELVNALRQNSTLTHINLEDNQITSNTALDFIAVLKQHNKTVQYLELKDNKVRSGLVSQTNKLLESRRSGYDVEPVVAATVSSAQVAPVTATPAVEDVKNASRNQKSSQSKKSGKSKSRNRGARHKSDR